MESVFHSLKAEVVHGATSETEADLRLLVARYIQYYDHRRRSAVRCRSSVAFERKGCLRGVNKTGGRSRR